MNFQDQNQAVKHLSGAIVRRDAGVGDLSLPVVSLLLGFLVAGSAILGAAFRLHGSVSSRYGDVGSAMGDKGDVNIEGASRIWIDLLSGIFIMGIPAFAETQQNTGTIAWLKDVVIAVTVVQILACGAAGTVSWLNGGKVKELDGKVLGLSDATEGGRVKFFGA